MVIVQNLKFNLNDVMKKRYIANVLSNPAVCGNLEYEDVEKIVDEAFEIYEKRGTGINRTIANKLFKLHNIKCDDTDFWNYKPYEFVATQLLTYDELKDIGCGIYEGNSTCMGIDGGRRVGYLDFLSRGGIAFKIEVLNRKNERVSLGRLLLGIFYFEKEDKLGNLKSIEDIKIENLLFVATNVYLNCIQSILPKGVDSFDYRVAVSKMFLKALKNWIKEKYAVDFIFVLSNRLADAVRKGYHSEFYWNGDDVMIMSKKFGDTVFEHFSKKLRHLISEGYVLKPIGNWFYNWSWTDAKNVLLERIDEMLNKLYKQSEVENAN